MSYICQHSQTFQRWSVGDFISYCLYDFEKVYSKFILKMHTDFLRGFISINISDYGARSSLEIRHIPSFQLSKTKFCPMLFSFFCNIINLLQYNLQMEKKKQVTELHF
jgi:hypothetical protein